MKIKRLKKRAKTMQVSSAKWMTAFGLIKSADTDDTNKKRQNQYPTTELLPLEICDPFRVPAHAIHDLLRDQLTQLEKKEKYKNALHQIYQSMQVCDDDGSIITSSNTETNVSVLIRIVSYLFSGLYLKTHLGDTLKPQ